MANNTINEYLGYYQGKQREIFATTLLDAKLKAMSEFNPPKSKAHLVRVHLVKVGARQVETAVA